MVTQEYMDESTRKKREMQERRSEGGLLLLFSGLAIPVIAGRISSTKACNPAAPLGGFSPWMARSYGVQEEHSRVTWGSGGLGGRTRIEGGSYQTAKVDLPQHKERLVHILGANHGLDQTTR